MRIFVAPELLRAGAVSIRGEEHHYLGRVRRARPGDELELLDGAGRHARARIVQITERETVALAEAPAPVPPSVPRVAALIPWIKGERMDVCVEKLVEVGCDDIVVWPAARAVVQLAGERRAARIAKLAAVAVAAARQAGRAHVPVVSGAESLAAALAALPAGGARYALDPAATARLPQGDGLLAHVTLVSGPEGGLAPEELAALAATGCVPVGLGPRVLRAETAPVIAVALVRAATQT